MSVRDRLLTRRTVVAAAASIGLGSSVRRRVDAAEPVWSYPLAWPGRIPGDGFFIKHGFGCENPSYYPGLRHTGENWYGLTENAAGADVLAVSDGTVVYADYDYPGRVVILEHTGGLFSVYGHLDYGLAVAVGDAIVRGERLGAVLARPDEFARSHLHFEIRTFYLRDEVNGDHPRHGFTCGYRCPPGPGYWPLDAPEHPADLGWLNPVHVIARRMSANATGNAAQVVVVSEISSQRLPTWSDLPWRDGSVQLDGIEIASGDRFRLTGVKAGSEATRGRNAAGYRLWYRIERRSSETVWVNALAPDASERNLDGSPAGIRFDLLPVIDG